MPQIHIGRGTTNLGVFDVEEIKAGLASGRFFLSDFGWKEGMEGWKPLSEFPELAEAPTHPPILPEGVERTAFAAGAASGAEGMPWERREEIGWIQAYWQTVKLVLLDPVQAFTNMEQEGGLGSPLLFAVIGSVIGGVARALYAQAAFMNPSFASQLDQFPPQFRPLIKSLMGAGVGLGSIIIFPILAVIGLFIISGINHLCLMLVGGAKRPFETTFRVVCFSLGATSLLAIIPVCGNLISGVWDLIVKVIGLAKAHEIETGRSLAAVLLPLICCCAFLVAAVVAAIAMGASHR